MDVNTTLDNHGKRLRHLEMLENVAGELPPVAGMGYALVSDAVNSWIADQTPLWTGEHSFQSGVAFVGASDTNAITVPDDTAIALELLDAGGLEYLRINSENANPYFLIDPGATGVNVGIGEPAPDFQLHLTRATLPGIKLEHTTTSSYSAMYFYEGITPLAGYLAIGSAHATVARRNNLEITTFNGGDIVLQRTVGNVGIGTSAPLSELDVRGTISGIDELILSDITDLVNYITGPTNRSLTIRTGVTNDINDVLGLDVHTGAAYQRIMTLRRDGNVGIGTPTPGSLMEWNFATENLEFVDAGSAAATEQDWIEVQVGNVTGYIRVFAAK